MASICMMAELCTTQKQEELLAVLIIIFDDINIYYSIRTAHLAIPECSKQGSKCRTC